MPFKFIREDIRFTKDTFKICEIKMIKQKTGIFHSKFYYIHFDGNEWKILIQDLDNFEYIKIS